MEKPKRCIELIVLENIILLYNYEGDLVCTTDTVCISMCITSTISIKSTCNANYSDETIRDIYFCDGSMKAHRLYIVSHSLGTSTIKNIYDMTD